MTLDTAPAVSHRQRAADLIALGKFDRVAHEARRALGRNPEDAEAHRLLAWALWAKGENSRADLMGVVEAATESAL